MDCEKHDNIIVDVIGYIAISILCLRLIPPIFIGVWWKRKIEIEQSLLFMEFIGCILYIIYGKYYNINIIVHSNTMIFGSVVTVFIYNKYHNFAVGKQWRMVESEHQQIKDSTKKIEVKTKNNTLACGKSYGKSSEKMSKKCNGVNLAVHPNIKITVRELH